MGTVGPPNPKRHRQKPSGQPPAAAAAAQAELHGAAAADGAASGGTRGSVGEGKRTKRAALQDGGDGDGDEDHEGGRKHRKKGGKGPKRDIWAGMGWQAVEVGDDFLLGAEDGGFAGLEVLDASVMDEELLRALAQGGRWGPGGRVLECRGVAVAGA